MLSISSSSVEFFGLVAMAAQDGLELLVRSILMLAIAKNKVLA